jgi:hypothetical protein
LPSPKSGFAKVHSLPVRGLSNRLQREQRHHLRVPMTPERFWDKSTSDSTNAPVAVRIPGIGPEPHVLRVVLRRWFLARPTDLQRLRMSTNSMYLISPKENNGFRRRASFAKATQSSKSPRFRDGGMSQGTRPYSVEREDGKACTNSTFPSDVSRSEYSLQSRLRSAMRNPTTNWPVAVQIIRDLPPSIPAAKSPSHQQT